MLKKNDRSRKALERLIEGNNIYIEEEHNKSLTGREIRVKLAKEGQKPYACVICCSDSRVVPMHIFTAGIGEIFVIETAGNLVDALEIASAEYAAYYLGVPLIVVLAHNHCGAIEAALDQSEKRGYLKELIQQIRDGFGDERDPDKCALLNAENCVNRLMTSEIISELVVENKLDVVAAMYDIETGYVEFEI